MDFSKLPKMSSAQATPETSPPEPVESVKPPVAPNSAAENWISIAIGLILLLISTRIIHFLFSHSTFESIYSFTDEQGNPLVYTKSVFFWGDLALLVFAVVLIVDGVVMAIAPRRAVVMFALTLTIASTLLNLGYVVHMMNGYGVQIMPSLAVAFGVYIAMYQWKLLRCSK